MNDESSVVLPGWVRVVALGFAALFGILAFWLGGRVDDSGFLAGAGAAIATALTVGLLVAAVRGRLWRWVWFVPGL